MVTLDLKSGKKLELSEEEFKELRELFISPNNIYYPPFWNPYYHPSWWWYGKGTCTNGTTDSITSK